MKKIRILFPLILVLTLIAGSACAQVVFRMEGIPGSHKDSDNPDWIDVFYLKFFTGNMGSAGHKNRFEINGLEFSHEIDEATAPIKEAFEEGKIIPVCEVFSYSGSVISRHYILKDVRITDAHFNNEPSGGGYKEIQYVRLAVGKAEEVNFAPDYKLPKTGDDTPLLLWVLLTAVSFTALILLRTGRRNVSD